MGDSKVGYFVKIREADHLKDCWLHYVPDKGYVIGRGFVGACGFKKAAAEEMVKDMRNRYQANICYIVTKTGRSTAVANEQEWLAMHPAQC